MEVAYSAGEWPQAEIIASPEEYAAIAGRVAELARAGSGEIVFSAANHGRLSVRVRSGPVVVAVGPDGELSVIGGPEPVDLFGRNMPSEPSLPPGYHVHFEHAGREGFVAVRSVPLVMVVGSRT